MKLTGVLFIVMGVLCLLFPILYAVWLNYLFAVLLIVGGIIHFWMVGKDSSDHRLQHVLLALFYLLGGIALAFFPGVGILTMTLLLGAVFFAHGVASVALYFSLRGVAKKWLVLFSGVLEIVLGVMIAAGLPSSSAWVIGTLAGVNFIFFGFSLFTLDREMRALSA
ncbi:MAG: DUF308 domain-containing protein [Parvularculaceae bacterium]|nr:DUF308 domain-containing protein [Parvularculaceae bacterium]